MDITTKWRSYAEARKDLPIDERIKELNTYLYRYFGIVLNKNSFAPAYNNENIDCYRVRSVMIYLKQIFKEPPEKASSHRIITSFVAKNNIDALMFPTLKFEQIPYSHGELMAAAMLLGYRYRVDTSLSFCLLRMEPKV